MDNSIKILIKNFSHVFSANVISILISILSIMIIPKIIGGKEYGYWQLYLFYVSYSGFFHFGHADGAYLKYGGMKYDQLKKDLFVSQFWIVVIFELFLAGIIFLWSFLNNNDLNKIFIICMFCINLIAVLPKMLLICIMQATNKMKEYARVIAFERIIYGIVAVTVVASGIRDYKILIYVDLIAKFIAFAVAVYYCSDIVVGKSVKLIAGLKEAFDNVRIGIKLMFACIGSMLIIGIVRLGIEQKWEVETFGKVSLTLSISNMLMIFVNALGTVLFPMLRNIPIERLSDMYVKMRNVLMIPMIGMLVTFYPVKWIFTLWLPQYSEALHYMALLFPICIYESKISMLINTYLKTLRKEKLMMTLNWTAVFMSLITTYFCIVIFGNLTMSVLSITLLLAFRCILSEVFLAREINIIVGIDIILEVTITIIFIITAWFMGNIYGFLVFGASYVTYLLIKRKDVKETLRLLLTVARPQIQSANR